MLLQSLLVVAAFGGLTVASDKKAKTVYKHVAAFSIDGLHSSDLPKYVAIRPNSVIAELLETGYEFTDAYTSAPSDSFPGAMSMFTGASPRTHGVWYDDTYDRKFWLPYSTTGSNCQGPPGAEVLYDETKDYDSTLLFSGGINPLNLPQTLVNGVCTNLYPHQRSRVNTVFEVVHEAGHQTAYTDKHPAYDLVRGPTGKGLSVGFFPEIAAVAVTTDATIAYDQLHVNAFIDWIMNGTTPEHSEIQEKLTGVPTLFGGNFQAVSVAQKTSGYVPKTLSFTPQLLKALDFVDAALGQVVAALKAKGIYDETLITVVSKHGQSPIDPAKYAKINGDLISAATGVDVLQATTDDIALIFLKDQTKTAAAVAGLNKQRAALKIEDIIYGDRLIELGFGNPLTDSAVPDIIVRPTEGIVYTTSTAKIAEHGGINEDDRKVACFVSAPGLKKKQVKHKISTRQLAPTILKALGLDPKALKGVVAEGTEVLHGF
ncbi:hypothetical protein VE03_08811 [Pseudogymnoascus sp. 23342-1-I1]|nr:hypothetical protein VE03_08811 [Pseudogymnoascus sp. 23342-1-I1]